MNALKQPLLTLLLVAATLIAGIAKAEVTYFHHDALGSVVAATDESGAVLWRENYKPYGDRLTRAVSTDEQSVYYTGKPHDDRTGLTYFGARYYDPLVGRFMGIDPVGVDPNDTHSFNRYAYANNNPYKYIDPDGNLAFLPVLVFIAKEIASEAIERTTGLPALFSIKGAAKAIGKKLGISGGKEAASEVAKKTDTLQPGPFAKESIPGHRGRPTAEEQRQVNALMEKHGCHTCGTKDAGTKSGNAIADHQPPQALDEPKKFLPHCNHCKARQGGQVLQEKRRRAKQ